jgi:cell surface protein SprA
MISVLFEVRIAHAQERADSVLVSNAPDTLASGTQYFNAKRINRVSKLSGLTAGKLYSVSGGDVTTNVTWDSLNTYRIQTNVLGYQTTVPTITSFEGFSALKKQQSNQRIRAKLVQESKNQQQESRGLLDFSINVPGGENSAFSTIFGSNEVNLRVNGSANMNVGASVQKLDDGTLPPDLRTRVDPTFNQNLQLNIQGTIGDKLTIATDWDTERQFDFENRLSIRYQGYEDEIIKSIEMGNVSMATGNSLVKGGSSLFGIKAVSELGPLKVTTVVSQQRGESNTQSISGGSQENSIELRPADYEDGRHFFLDFYNRQEFETALSNPQQILQPYQITEIQVYVRKAEQVPGINTVSAIALLDLGVNDEGNDTFGLPGNDSDRYPTSTLEELRPTDSNATNEDFGVNSQEYVDAIFEQLVEGVDYTVNYSLGYISMKSFINSGDAIAVAYTYSNPQNAAEVIQVGELDTQNSSRTYLKLLRPGGMTTEDRAWPLTMRNIYSLGVSGITQEGFELEIADTRNNIPETNLPGRGEALLADLGLDRQQTDGSIGSDNQIDFSGVTLDGSAGRIIFPYLEPFGDRIADVLKNSTNAPDSVIEALSFKELYDLKPVDAKRSSKNTFYAITGSSSGGVSGSFTLGFGLVEGSVTVTANGVTLVEDVDYEVDYSFGSLTILNDRYLAPGQEIEVEYENNQFALIGQKNFTGVRAEYTISDDVSIGSTFFKLKEQPLSDKIRIGNEPINNTILGLDAKANFEAPWLTRFIDKIPLLQTRAESNINFSGEFAQLRPGVAQTNAVQEAIDRGDLFRDEENGLVFIDDFEGAEYTINFSNPTRWNLASAPAAVPGLDEDADFFNGLNQTSVQTPQFRKDRADLRSQFSWYTIPRNIQVSNEQATAEVDRILINDIFQGRVVSQQETDRINSLDIYYNPQARGQYNYNYNLKDLLELQPDRTWGGMTVVIPTGQEDLVQNNIEFLEFWVQAILPDGQEPAGQEPDYEGKIYIDLGTISEDIIPNARLNTEDGLSTTINNLTEDDPSGQARSYIPPTPPVPLGQFSTDQRALEDVGLDGAPNPGTFGAENRNEGVIFQEFVDRMREQYGESSPEFEAIEADPSNDDYVYYGENKVRDLPLKDRFYRLLGYHDGNTPESGGSDNKTAITLKPDSEGLISSSSILQTNSYYQYELDFNPADVDELEVGAPGTYIVDKIDKDPYYKTWYLVRIPLKDFTRRYGEIESFQNISHMRVWMSGYKKPFTLRFATFEFVGSQWNKVDNLTESPATLDGFEVSTINIEENANRVPFPYRQPEGSIRAINRGAQVQTVQNEQSLVLSVDALGPGEIHMVKRVYTGNLNLLNYSNMRMFVHGEGFDERGDAELVIRMGNDLENNFYEYRQPVTPSIEREFSYSIDNQGGLLADAEDIWLYDENSMNIIISVLNVLKQNRNASDWDPSQLFEQKGLLGEDGVEGAVLAIKGNPSLDKVSEIGLGIRNPFDPSDVTTPGQASLSAQFWLNELRVSGFDNEKGWAANAKSSVKLADFATLNANLTRRTNGFGGLESQFESRSVSEQFGYNLSTTVNLHKLVPDRFGWNFPVTISTTRDTQTPKFLPDQGDIRLTDFKDAVNSNDNLTSEQQRDSISTRIEDIQTINERFSINFSDISKRNSKSELAKYTIDNMRLSYVYNTGSAQNPQLQFQNKWDYQASVSYNLSLRRVKLFTPFGFTRNIPLIKVLSGFRMGYLPSSLTFSSGLTRNYSESRRRSLSDPNAILPLQQSHNFTQRNNFGLNYNLTPSIPISFRTSTNFDLANAGIETRNAIGADSLAYDVKPTFDVLQGIVSDTLTARRSTYQENYSASWRPNLNNIKPLNWLTYSMSYGGGFQWNNSPRGSNLGASVSNNFQLDNSLKIDVEDILGKIGFIGKMKDADGAETKARKDAKEARKREAEQEMADSLRTPRPTPDLVGDLAYVGRKVFLAAFSMKELSGSYKRSKTGSQPGYQGQSQIFYAFNTPGSANYSPPFAYRTGFMDRISQEQLINNSGGDINVQLPANNSVNDTFTAKTRINLFPNLSIDLDWSAAINNRSTTTITVTPDGEYSSVVNESGGYNASVWAFGDGYEKLFRNQLETAYADINEGSDVITDSLGNNDGRFVLNRNTLEEDFRDAYLGSNVKGLGSKGLFVFPRPGWRINWNRFQEYLPFIGQFMSNATLSHSYQGSYKVDWALNTLTGQQSPQTLGNAYDIIDDRRRFEPTTLRAERRFSPLVKLSMTWESNLRTEFGYNRSTISTFAIASKRATETLSQGIDFSMNYVFRNVKLKMFPKIKNNIDLSLRGSYKNDTDLSYKLDSDIGNALIPNAPNVLPVEDAEILSSRETGQQRINGTFSVGYKISSSISSNFEYTYSRIQSNNIPTRTNHDIRFNVRIAISSR